MLCGSWCAFGLITDLCREISLKTGVELGVLRATFHALVPTEVPEHCREAEGSGWGGKAKDKNVVVLKKNNNSLK